MYNPFSLENKTILVTGASSGIGRKTAIDCSKMGAHVILTARNIDKLESVFNELDTSLNQSHKILPLDLSTDEGICLLAKSIDCIDGLVYSSGINDKSLLKFINREKLIKQYNINVFSPMLLLKEITKGKKLNKGASIVLISSISSMYATVSNSIYASTKGAINSLIRVQALEMSKKNIRVNGIMPGMVNTDMIKSYGLSEEALQNVIADYPLGRLGETEDISNAIIYLLSNASNWVTGANIVIDGGVTLR